MSSTAIMDPEHVDHVARTLAAEWEGWVDPETPAFVRRWHCTYTHRERDAWRGVVRLAARLLGDENGRSER